MSIRQDKRLTKGAKTRLRILEATTALLGKGGLESLSASAVAKQAGISKATLFHHFDTVDDILFASVQGMLEQFEQVLEQHPYSNVKEYLFALSAASEESHAESNMAAQMAIVSFMMKASYDKRYRPLLVGMLNDYYDRVATELARLSGRPKEDPVIQNAATQVMTLGDGIGLHAMVLGASARLGTAWKSFAETTASLLSKTKE